jgi:cell division protein FtsW
MYMATWLTGKRERVRSFTYGLVQFGVLMGVLVWLLMLEPDLGTSVLLVTIGAAMFFVSGAQIMQFVGTMLIGGAAFMALALSASYRRDRLLVFLNPDGDLRNLGWQLFQARLALGSGGLLGLGLGASRQKFSWLPAAHHDAIFAVIGEELGLVGCSLVLLLFVAFAWRGYAIARNARDSLGYPRRRRHHHLDHLPGRVHIGGVTVAVPFTGIPLPFVSAGGTALIVTLTSVGVLLNVSRQASLQPAAQTAAATSTATVATTTSAKPARPKPRRTPTRPATTARSQAPAGKSSRAVRSRAGSTATTARAASIRPAGSRNDWN